MGTSRLVSLLMSLATLVVISNGQHLCSRHYELTPIHQFNNLMMLGNWTLFKSYAADAADATPLGRCATARIAVSDLPTWYPLSYREGWIDTDGNERLDGYWTTIDTTRWAVWSGIDSFLFPATYRHSVFLHTDYINYAMQFSCTERVNDTHLYEKMNILTKTRNPDPELITIVKHLVEAYDFSLENEIPIDHTNCE